MSGPKETISPKTKNKQRKNPDGGMPAEQYQVFLWASTHANLHTQLHTQYTHTHITHKTQTSIHVQICFKNNMSKLETKEERVHAMQTAKR